MPGPDSLKNDIAISGPRYGLDNTRLQEALRGGQGKRKDHELVRPLDRAEWYENLLLLPAFRLTMLA